MVKDHSDSDRHWGYSFRLTSRVILYAPSHRQDDIAKNRKAPGENGRLNMSGVLNSSE